MWLSASILLSLSLAYTSFAQLQQPLEAISSKDAYNITLNFDDLPTNSHGIGFHPTSPRQPPYAYNSLYLQSFTLLNTTAANLTTLDRTCSRSKPNSIFAHRRNGYAWPRISIHDLSKPAEELRRDVRNSNETFGLVSLWVKPTGNITGDPQRTFGTIGILGMRLNPDPRADIPPDAGFPGVVRGEPLPLAVGNVTSLGIFFPPGAHDGLALDLRRIFGPEFGKGIDVLEFTGQVFRMKKGELNFEVAEDWEVCFDDLKLEIISKDKSMPIVNAGSYGGVRLDGSRIGREDPEWEVMKGLSHPYMGAAEFRKPEL